MLKARRLALVATWSLVGCTSVVLGTNESSLATNVLPGTPVQVTGTSPPESTHIQSEVAISVSPRPLIAFPKKNFPCPALPPFRRICFAYNSFRDALNVASNGPFLDAAYSDDLGKSWTKSSLPNLSQQNVPYKLQYVDPAAVACADPNHPFRVFIGSLATTATQATFTSFPPPTGACIYRSDDAGATFVLDHCLPETGPGALSYDGASFACDGAGNLYAAFAAYDPNTAPFPTRAVDVYQRDPLTGIYSLLVPPYPLTSPTRPLTHPRLAATDAGVYLSVPTTARTSVTGNEEGPIELSFLPLNGMSWVRASMPSTKAVWRCNQLSGSSTFHVAPDHALDVGAASALGNDEVRAIYGADVGTSCPSSGPVALRTLHCNLGLTACGDEDFGTGWATNPSGFEINPGIQQFPHPGIRGWAVSYQLAAGSSVEYVSAEMKVKLVNNVLVRVLQHDSNVDMNGMPQPEEIVPLQTACPGSQYWGDYDDMKTLGFGCMEGGNPHGVARALFPLYIRSFTDSRLGNCAMDGTPQHVGSVSFFE